ncbi:MAG: insulinase family protein [Bacteroidales bacterium]|jgi:zinc protease|nr:insulinase family protein [Bacteroidales bacterium]
MKRFFKIFVLLFLANTCFAQTAGLDRPIPVDPKVKIGKLENGLTYYIRKNPKPEKRVELRLAVNAGSILEDETQLGLAHFTEHMAFNGSKHFPKNELVKYLQSIGMSFGGDLNAYTGFDETVYRLTVPTDNEEQFNNGMLVLADWANGLLLEGKEIDAERGVIIEEWRTGLGAQDRMQKKWFPVLFSNSRYADRLPIGTLENLKAFKHETLRKFYQDWYRPNLQAVIVVGDIDLDATEAKIKELFGAFKNPENAPERAVYSIGENKDPLVVQTTDKEATSTVIMTVRKHKGREMNTLNDLRSQFMIEMFNSMLNERYEEYRQDTASPFIAAFGAYSDLVGKVDAFMGQVITKENRMNESFIALLREEERVKQYGFLPTELARAKEEYLSILEKRSNEVSKTNSSNFASEYVDHFLYQEAIPGAKIMHTQAKKLLEDITVEEINELAKKLITDENLVVVIMGPQQEGVHIMTEAEAKDILNKKEYKEVTPYVDKFKEEPLLDKELQGGTLVSKRLLADVDATEYTLKNGVKVVVKVTDFKDDEILMKAMSPGGSSLVSDEDLPSATFATIVLGRSGLGAFDKVELEKKLKGKYVGINPVISDLYEGFTATSTPKDIETLMQLIYLYFDNPRIDENMCNLVVSEIKNQIKFLASNPQIIFIDTLYKVAYQNDIRQTQIPDEKFMDAVTYEKVKKVYLNRFADASDFVFTFVGNIDETTFIPLVEKYLGNLPSTGRVETYKDVNKPFISETKSISVKAGMEEQGILAIVFEEKMNWDVKNVLSFDIFSEVIDMLLIEKIREKMGGAYSPSMELSTDKLPEPTFSGVIYIACDPKKAKKISSACLKLLNDLFAKGINDDHFGKAVAQIKKSREVSAQENSYWRGYISNKLFNNDNLKDRETYNNLLETITKEEVLNTVKSTFNMNHYLEVILYPEKTGKKK